VKNQPATIRLLDIGGDKKLTYLSNVKDEDSFLGQRGIRLLLEYPELLYTQFNALIKLSADYNIKILIPMVTVSREMEIVQEIFNELYNLSGMKKKIPIGVMIETPAAALCIEDFLHYADFLSIGTNDLTQYTMAAGRENHSVAHYFLDNHKSIFKLIQMVVSTASHIPVSLCGELASNCEMLPQLLNSGIKSLSVSPSFIPEIKELIRST
jgi:phosphoenolpyruvate-protein kinase (PTS system EI component)